MFLIFTCDSTAALSRICIQFGIFQFYLNGLAMQGAEPSVRAVPGRTPGWAPAIKFCKLLGTISSLGRGDAGAALKGKFLVWQHPGISPALPLLQPSSDDAGRKGLRKKASRGGDPGSSEEFGELGRNGRCRFYPQPFGKALEALPGQAEARGWDILALPGARAAATAFSLPCTGGKACVTVTQARG